MRAMERTANLRQGSSDEFMEGFGVTDRVGVILGGKFIDPNGDVQRIFQCAHRSRPDDPTYVPISGAPGVGKSEFIEQLELAFVRAGVRCLRIVSGSRLSFMRAVAAELGNRKDRGDFFEPSPAEVAAMIGDAAVDQPIAIMLDGVDTGLQSDALEAKVLAQHIFAASFENATPIQAVIVMAERNETDAEVYSVRIHLSGLDEESCHALAEGLLGRLDISAGALSALHRASGGNPSSLQTILFDLIARGSLERLGGSWKLAEVGRLTEGASPTLESRWRSRWRALGCLHQDLLGAVALTSGLDMSTISQFEAEFAERGAAAKLRSTGWLKLSAHRTLFASEGLRGIVLKCLDEARKRELATKLLKRGFVADGPLAIAIQLLAHPDQEVVLEAINLATAAIKARDLPTARALLGECVQHESTLPDPIDRAAIHIKLAEILMESGEIESAEQHLRNRSVATMTSQRSAGSANIHLLLGTIAGRAGQLDEARLELGNAIDDAQYASDRRVYFRALAAFAELSWTHGNDHERLATITLVENALTEASQLESNEEERGQLVYGLGSAHIRTGQLEKAVAILDSELPRLSSAYWGARIANALGTACFYLGRPDDAMTYLARGLQLLADGAAPDIRARIHANRGACLISMGCLREALDENERALAWSRRAGSGYDTIAAAAGIAIDLIYLGRFDEANAKAQEVFSLASRISNVVYQFKGLELEGFSSLAMGNLKRVEDVLSRADQLPQNYEPGRTRPRVELLRARQACARGRSADALRALNLASELLKGDSDLEDVWGIEVEFAALNQAESGLDRTLAALAAIALKANEAKILVVEIQAAVSIAQILLDNGKAGANLIPLLTAILGRAEESGFIDHAWRINLGLGIALIETGDVRAGQARLIQTQRLLVQIADGLSPESRRTFVRSPHVAPVLEVIARRITSKSTR